MSLKLLSAQLYLSCWCQELLEYLLYWKDERTPTVLCESFMLPKRFEEFLCQVSYYNFRFAARRWRGSSLVVVSSARWDKLMCRIMLSLARKRPFSSRSFLWILVRWAANNFQRLAKTLWEGPKNKILELRTKEKSVVFTRRSKLSISFYVFYSFLASLLVLAGTRDQYFRVLTLHCEIFVIVHLLLGKTEAQIKRVQQQKYTAVYTLFNVVAVSKIYGKSYTISYIAWIYRVEILPCCM